MTKIQTFDFSVNVLRALLWQYQPAVALQSLLSSKKSWYDENQAGFWSDWYRDVFNLQTANDFGLSVWGIILDIPLSYVVPARDNDVFGFEPYYQNFDNGNFASDEDTSQSLTTEQKRLILRLRYFQLVSDGSVPYTNFILREVFGQGFVLDNLNMECTYVFPEQLSSAVLAVLQEFDILPRPAGVKLNFLIAPGAQFGFDPYYANFDNGYFGA